MLLKYHHILRFTVALKYDRFGQILFIGTFGHKIQKPTEFDDVIDAQPDTVVIKVPYLIEKKLNKNKPSHVRPMRVSK